MDFQIQRAVDTSNVSDTPPQSLKKRKKVGEIWKSQSLPDWELRLGMSLALHRLGLRRVSAVYFLWRRALSKSPSIF